MLGLTVAGAEPDARNASGLTELRSSASLLAVTLVAAEAKVRIGDLEVDGATYNGLYAGPVLRVRPGDLLRILLVNHLSQPTNLHFHGIQSSPLGNGDNAHLAVASGDSFTYEVRIPITQPPGLYWYHSHMHGLAEAQVMRGLSGALVVDPAAAPGAASTAPAERLFVLKDMTFDDATGNPKIDGELHGLVRSVNGGLDLTETMRPSETQLWRFVNQSANLAIHIALQGHCFRIVGEDGEATLPQDAAKVLDLMPSARIDVLVEGGAPGSYALLSIGTLTGMAAGRTADRVLGHLVVVGTLPAAGAVVMSTGGASGCPTSSGVPPWGQSAVGGTTAVRVVAADAAADGTVTGGAVAAREAAEGTAIGGAAAADAAVGGDARVGAAAAGGIAPVARVGPVARAMIRTAAVVSPPDLRAVPIDARRTVVFSQTATLDADAQRFFINGLTFDANRIDVRVPLGHVEEWTIRNDSDDLHVFHMHQLNFQVVEVNGTAVPFTGRVDGVRVPERGEVKLRLAFTDPLILGRFVFHCHVLRHEDKGMMAQIEVYDPRPPVIRQRLRGLYLHVWWWLHGVPWSLCGLGDA